MTKYNFDKPVRRKGSCCTKWDALQERYGRKDLISMWIADMDFETPRFFTDALVKRIKGGVLGYGCRPQEWYDAIIAWCAKKYNWQISREQIGFVPGIVVGLCHALRCFTKPGDKVLIQPPVYPPFANQVLAAGCKVVNSQLHLVEKVVGKGKEQRVVEDLEIDWEDFDKKMQGCKAFILCNPHNPGGKHWKLAEMRKMAQICLKHNVMVFSDEIHCDLTFGAHIPFATVNKELAKRMITFRSPSKTFNCAGIGASEWIATDITLHDAFENYLKAGELDGGHFDSFYPARLLYSKKGEEWREQMMDYLKGNIEFVENFLRDNFTFDTLEDTKTGRAQLITMIEPQASFLIFLNFRKLGLTQEQLCEFLLGKAHLALNDGTTFGPGGEGFMRLNVGCPRSVLEKAMKQLKKAFDRHFNL